MPKRTNKYVAVADANGEVQIRSEVVGSGKEWVIDRMTTETNSAAASQLHVYLDEDGLGNLLDYTGDANQDVAEYASGLYVPPGSSLLFKWSDLTVGAYAAVRLQYSDTPTD